MLKIAVCDDIIETSLELEKIVEGICKKHSIRNSIKVFYNGSDLLNHIKNEGSFDLIFLDIEMKDIDGIEVGGTIRDDLEDNDTKIAYISGKTHYAMSLFEVRL